MSAAHLPVSRRSQATLSSLAVLLLLFSLTWCSTESNHNDVIQDIAAESTLEVTDDPDVIQEDGDIAELNDPDAEVGEVVTPPQQWQRIYVIDSVDINDAWGSSLEKLYAVGENETYFFLKYLFWQAELGDSEGQHPAGNRLTLKDD